jgi:hypothetical protein
MTHTYIAKNGVVVTTCHDDRSAEEDFPTVFHYMHWSYGSWVRRIVKDIKLGKTEKREEILSLGR